MKAVLVTETWLRKGNMYKKNKISSHIRFGIPYKCGCIIPKNQYSKQLFFGSDYCTRSFLNHLLSAIENGEFGSEWYTLLKEHPMGTVDTKLGLYLCEECGHWENEECLDFYDAVTNEIIKDKSLELLANKSKYRLLKKYIHRCPKCNLQMKEIVRSVAVIRDAHLICPKCQQEIELVEFYG